MKRSINTKNHSKKRFLWLAVVLVPLLVVGAAFAYHQSKKPKPAETTSKSKTAQSNYSGGKERDTDVQSGGTDQGGATDNKGQQPSGGDQNTASVTSDSGAITVKGIAQNSLLSSGDTLYGTTTGTAPIQFRIIDEQVGVVAQGSLTTVNGAFSGKLSFTPRSSTGRVDVYTTDSLGSELNNIEIPVRFK